MRPMKPYDVVIIGAGVIGAAAGRELSRYKLNIAILEKEEEYGFGVSKSNSGIIHPGTQNPTGSLKARLCVGGNILIRKIARELEKGELRCIYIPSEEDQHLRSLCRLYHRVVENVTRVKNRIKEHLYFNGIELPKHSSHWSGRFIAHLRSLPLDRGPA